MIYLDNAATSFPKPEGVYEALDLFARTTLANPGRAGHKMALAAEHALDDARHRLNQFFKGKAPDHWIFTLNGTDALNMAFKGVLNDGDHVVTTDLEHNSVSRPLVALAEAGRIALTRVAADSCGTVDAGAIASAFTPKTRLVAVTHASNVLGTVQPIEEIGKLVRSRGALFIVDAAQTAGVIPLEVQAANIDLLAFPGHKSQLGPTGPVHALCRTRASLRPWREGHRRRFVNPTQPKEFPTTSKAAPERPRCRGPLVAGLVSLNSGGSTRSTSTRSICATVYEKRWRKCRLRDL